MNLTLTLARGRAMAESLMTDACTITRQTGRTRNTTTNDYTPTMSSVYAGKCRVQTNSTASVSGDRDAGDRLIVTSDVVISVPVGTTGVAQGDIVTITAAAFNPQLADATFRVHSIQDKSQPTALRLECESTR